MLYLPSGTALPERVHGAFVSDDEVHRVVEHLKAMGPADYVDGVLDEVQTMGDGVVVGATGLPRPVQPATSPTRCMTKRCGWSPRPAAPRFPACSAG